MRASSIILLAFAGTTAMAQPPSTPEADAARTVELNRSIQRNNDAIRDRNGAAEAAYLRDRAAYEAAKAENDRATATAAAAARAYQADRVEHEAAMARWRAGSGARAAAAPPVEEAAAEPPAARKLVCRDEAVAGSLARKVRRCAPR